MPTPLRVKLSHGLGPYRLQIPFHNDIWSYVDYRVIEGYWKNGNYYIGLGV